MGTALPGADPKTFTKTVPTGTAERLVAVSSTGDKRANGGIIIKALSTNTVLVYVGGSDVTTSNGYPLSASESISLAIDDPSRVWCISGSSSQVVRVLYL